MVRHNVYQDLLSGMLGSQEGDLDTQERSVVALATGATDAGAAGAGSETRYTDGVERPRDQEFCAAALAIDVPDEARAGRAGVVAKEASDACEELILSASVLRKRCAEHQAPAREHRNFDGKQLRSHAFAPVNPVPDLYLVIGLYVADQAPLSFGGNSSYSILLSDDAVLLMRAYNEPQASR